MKQRLLVIQQYLSWNGHYRRYFENLFDERYDYLYASNKPENYTNGIWAKSSFDANSPLTIKAKIQGRFFDSYQVFKKLGELRYDVIHFIEFEPLTYLLFSRRIRKGTQLLITIHSSDRLHFSSWINNQLSQFQRWLLSRALKRAVSKGAKIVTHYECHRGSIIDVIGEQYANRVVVIHYPAPEPELTVPRRKEPLKKPSFLIYGQIREDKGIFEFLSDPSTHDLQITVAGRVVDRRIFEFQKREGLNIIDKFLTEEEIDNLTATHDYMLLPYPLVYTNGAGTFKDSLAKGMPVICSDISIFREIVGEFQVGAIFNSVSEIAEITADVSAEQYRTWSENCLNYANTFDWPYMRAAYFKQYEDLLATASDTKEHKVT